MHGTSNTITTNENIEYYQFFIIVIILMPWNFILNNKIISIDFVETTIFVIFLSYLVKICEYF
jgi:hypothetical protein